MMNHMLHKRKVSLALRCQLTILVKTLVFHKLHICRPVCRIRRICNLYTELGISKVIVLQGVTIIDIETTIRNATKNHVHTCQVIGRGGEFLTVVVIDISIFLQTEKQGSRTTGRVSCSLHVCQTEASQTTKQLSRTGRSIEFSCFLTCSCSELSNQILVCISKNVNFGIFHTEIDFIQCSNDLGHNCTSILNSVSQFGRIELHIGEQSVKVFLRLVTNSGLHQRIDGLLQKLDIKCTVLDHLDHLTEEVLRLNNKAHVTQSFLNHSTLVLFVFPGIFIADVIVFEQVFHILLGLIREVVIENHTQYVVLELIGLHVTAQSVSHSPELITKFFLM